MQAELTTNDVRRILEDAGMVRPNIEAVRTVAIKIDELNTPSGVTRMWELRYPEELIREVVRSGASTSTGMYLARHQSPQNVPSHRTREWATEFWSQWLKNLVLPRSNMEVSRR